MVIGKKITRVGKQRDNREFSEKGIQKERETNKEKIERLKRYKEKLNEETNETLIM